MIWCSECFNKFIKWIDKFPVFNPSSNLKLVWDFAQLTIVIIFMFFIPIHIIFEISFANLVGDVITTLGPVLLIADNVVYLNMGIYEKGLLNCNRSQIFQYWLKSLAY